MMVSIIIPVYNVEQYLDRCLKSIENQSISDYEVILVDDGSEDSGGALCDEFANNKMNVSVIHQENQGLSAARNAGLKIAKGKYVIFVDSDDWVEPYLIEDLLWVAEKECCDIVVGKIVETCSDKTNYVHKAIKYKVYENNCIDLLFKGNIPNYACSVLIKREIFNHNHIKFKTDIYYEDMATMYKLYDNCSKIAIIKNNIYYNYFFRNNSIAHRIKKKNIDDALEILNEIEKHCFKSNSYYLDFYLLYKYFEILAMLISKSSLNRKEKNIYKEKIIRQCSKYKCRFVFSRVGIKVLLIKLGIANYVLEIKYRKK